MARAHAASLRTAPPRIRWDRVGRVALLAVLGIILLLYISPAKHWIQQSRTADALGAELRQLEEENRRLETRARELQRPDAVEREARKLGMVEQGERAFAIENPRP
jgi:cell division protein FtsB